MFRTVPLFTISFSLYTQQWYMSYRFANSLRASCQQTACRCTKFPHRSVSAETQCSLAIWRAGPSAWLPCSQNLTPIDISLRRQMNEVTNVPHVPNEWQGWGLTTQRWVRDKSRPSLGHPQINWWNSHRIPVCNLRAFPHVASQFHVTATRVCDKFLSICREVFRPLSTLRVVTILVLQFQKTDEFNHRLIRAQFPLTVAIYQSTPKSISDSRQVVSYDITIPLFNFSRTLNSHLTWQWGSPLPLRERI